MNNKLTSTIDPWYRHRWPWLLMLGPFVVVVAAAVTVYLAVISNDGLVDDDYYKQGLAINQLSARDQVAARHGLRAELMLSGERVRVILSADDTAVLPKDVVLHLTHPTRAGIDQTIALSAENGAGGLYSGRIAVPLQGRWHVVLEDGMKVWRLTGEWGIGASESIRLGAGPVRDGS
ncbi:MAG: FixH family protein [Propionivibrio sp.]